MEEEREGLQLRLLREYYRPQSQYLCAAFSIFTNIKLIALAKEFLKRYPEHKTLSYYVSVFEGQLHHKSFTEEEEEEEESELAVTREEMCKHLSAAIDTELRAAISKKIGPAIHFEFFSLGEVEMIDVVERMIFSGGLSLWDLLKLNNTHIARAVYHIKSSKRYKKAALRVVRYMISCIWHQAFLERTELKMVRIAENDHEFKIGASRSLLILSHLPMTKMSGGTLNWTDSDLKMYSLKKEVLDELYRRVLDNPHHLVTLRSKYADSFEEGMARPKDTPSPERYEEFVKASESIPLVCSEPFATDGSYVTDFDTCKFVTKNFFLSVCELFLNSVTEKKLFTKFYSVCRRTAGGEHARARERPLHAVPIPL